MNQRVPQNIKIIRWEKTFSLKSVQIVFIKLPKGTVALLPE